MAGTTATAVYDLISWAKTRAPDFGPAVIAELLNQSNEAMQDAVVLEGNLPTGHVITQRTGLPTTYTRQLNSPVQVSRGQTAQIQESMAIFSHVTPESYAARHIFAAIAASSVMPLMLSIILIS